MTLKLVIYDVSYLLHVGTKSAYKSESIMGVECGGLIYLMEKVFCHLSRGDSVALAFDSKCDKKELFPEYKATRELNTAIFVQNQMVFDFGLKMKLPVFKIDGYEADEVIFNLVRDNESIYQMIDIYCHDADIDCNLIRDGIRCIGCADKAPMITCENYQYEIFADTVIPYNAILPFILVFGKKSNNIPPLRLKHKAKNETIFRDFLSFCNAKNINSADYSSKSVVLRWLFSKVNLLDKEDYETLMRRINMIYPRGFSNKLIVSCDCKNDIDRDEMVKFMRIFGLKVSANNMNVRDEVLRADNSYERKRALLPYKNLSEVGEASSLEDMLF